MKEIVTEKNINRYVRVLKGGEWRTAADYPNYLVSSYGRCYSLYQGKLLTPILCADRKVLQYFCYKLTKDKKSKWVRVHRLVAETFFEIPESNYFVHHKDGNALNNRADNLLWVTFAEHMILHNKRARKTA